ncbi:type I 3-dehydroquinate dehydratase [Salipaludibacillus neizhouensis]|nr:type I 3-dehydroquinate dehydratase [Salipaludibacillus neizhouensis]
MNLSKNMLNNEEINKELPSICVPLIGKNLHEIKDEIEFIKSKKPDMIEWRADFFTDLNQEKKVNEVLAAIKQGIPETPVLLTIRSEKEGGQKISLSEDEKLLLFEKVSVNKKIDILDYELVNGEKNIGEVREITKQSGIQLMLSYHNFERTPDQEVLMTKCKVAESFKADLVKISVMSQSKDDVLLVLNVTNEASKTIKIPLVTISMGESGAITRLLGWAFGSTITYAIGAKSSAPGQMPIETLRSAINTMKKSL